MATNTLALNPALSALVSGVVDYAGLFPPATLSMADAVRAYASYLDDPARAMLGRFVVPVSRLREFEEAAVAVAVLPRDDQTAPWRVSALTGVDTAADIDLALRFNDRHADDSAVGRAVIDALELRVTGAVEIEAAMSRMPTQFSAYFEIPIVGDPDEIVDVLRRTGGYAKARTGGVTPEAFPTPHELARFMVRCRDAGVAFKLTAGLHHPLRGAHPLTYADDAPQATTFGYLNALGAAMLAWRGHDAMAIVAALEARDPAFLCADGDVLIVGSDRLDAAMIASARRATMHSFGSCSFREPVDELPIATITSSSSLS